MVSMNAGSSDESRRALRILRTAVCTGVDINEHVLAPQPLDDVFARDQLTSPLDEHDQEVHRLPFESNGAAATTQVISSDVQLEVAEAEPLAWVGYQHRGDFRKTTGSLQTPSMGNQSGGVQDNAS
jgi:hypothetical protein